MLISDLLDMRALDSFVEERVIAKRHHPDAPLHLYDYTAKAQYERIWTPETLTCRGLIVHDDGRVWSRPFPKFFNASEHGPDTGRPALPVHEPFSVFDKLDGSLGIAYRHPIDGTIRISTRGSFASDQAIHATEIVRARHSSLDDVILDEETWLFEIIYPTNRIVVDYGELDQLVLLAIIDNKTGRDLPMPGPDRWDGPTVVRHDSLTDWAALAASTKSDINGGVKGDDAEGYVVRFASGVRTKIKFEDYLRLHRLVTGVSSITLWEHLSAGLPLDELLDRVPDEFYGWVHRTAAGLRSQFQVIESECQAIMLSEEVDRNDRKRTALFFADQPHRAVLFKMFDGKRYAEVIWRTLRPEFAKPFRTVED
jgi:RNA ligase